MKRIQKSKSPKTLDDYIEINPDATWEQMRNDNTLSGLVAAHACRDQAIQDQGGLCAYCEQSISTAIPHRCGVEHFHPKSDKSDSHNWSLDWSNMLAVCDGGSRQTPEQKRSYSLPMNLSCDSHKNHVIGTKKAYSPIEGKLLNPLLTPSFPNLFAFDKESGELASDDGSCNTVNINDNAYETTTELVNQTIRVLNLNCKRLTDSRKVIVESVDDLIFMLRKAGCPPASVYEKLADRYFKTKWPEFFTTLRCLLGTAAEDYLKSVNYQG